MISCEDVANGIFEILHLHVSFPKGMYFCMFIYVSYIFKYIYIFINGTSLCIHVLVQIFIYTVYIYIEPEFRLSSLSTSHNSKPHSFYGPLPALVRSSQEAKSR